MNGPIKWMAHNHVASNLLMMILIVGGLIMAYSIKQEVFPEIDLDIIQVTVVYPGAGPEEVEDGIILKIEENLSSISGLKEIKAIASEGVGIVNAEVLPGEDIDIILQDVKAEVDRITTFPEDAEKAIITKIENRSEVVSVVIYGNTPERSLKEQAEVIRDELLARSEITQVDLRAVRPYEISVEVTEATLQRYDLTLGQLADRIRKASVDLPGGAVKSRGGEVLIRTKEKRYTGLEYADITILQDREGTEVKLGDIAHIRDDFQETDEFARLDGMPAAMVAVYRVGDQKPLEISNIVKEYVEAKRRSLPESLGLAVWNDFSDIYRSRLNLLLKNAGIGLILIFFILGLFLQIRLALWVMLGIPISFLGALLMMPSLDVSINMLSLFAFILALGIVVDDAIVVGENVYTHRGMKKPYMSAAIDGAIEVGRPVIFSVLTTVAAFMPLVFVSGTMGKFIRVIPLVVIPILIVSLVESLLILPAHLSFGRPVNNPNGTAGYVSRIKERFSGRLEGFVTGPYRRVLSFCIDYKYTTLASAIAILLIVAGIVGGGIIKFRFMPEVDSDLITSTLKLPIGTPVEETARAQDILVRKAQEVIADFDKDREEGASVIRHIYSTVGSTLFASPMGSSGSSGAHLTNVALLLTGAEKRGIASTEIAKKWRESVGVVPGADSVTFVSSLVGFGKNIDIRLAHDDFEILAQAVTRIKQSLRSYPGVSDIDDSYTQGKRELKITLRPEARTLGITEEDLGRQIRDAFYGAEALRLQRGRNEVKVMVRYPEQDRKSLRNLESMRIRTNDGSEVPFSRAAYVEEGRGFSEINRTDRKRVINVTASVVSSVANAEEINLDLKNTVLDDLLHDYPGLTYDLEGEEKERMESMASMGKGFAMALLIIYALLAIPFRSYMQPFIIMSAIPFGIAGAVFGHLIMGFNLSILSMFGVVALTGVVVNDSLLLVNFVNELRREGVDMIQAVVQGAQRRFRPIVLTSLTTSLGLTPIILEKSMQAQFLIPMAISLGFGILFATFITLLLVPSLYLILEDLLRPFQKKTANESATAVQQ
ncbi:MAG: efflux RND transporter permease subunit [Nitrospiraceae bacterium]|nr:MAG: efflux RND transporter permease subunit [Nitrospiraceae bacterium]